MSDLKWYEYDQNNSGGYFIEDDMVCEVVFIQAKNYQEANSISDQLFGGRDSFCSCCGERWSHVYGEDEGYSEPHHYGDPVSECEAGTFRKKYVLHYYDRTVEFHNFKKED